MDGRKSARVDSLSKLQQQAMCSDLVCVCVSQLEDGHSLFDYEVVSMTSSN